MILTVQDAILKALPFGTIPPFEAGGAGAAPDLKQAPVWPPDLFGVAAHLLYRSTAYHRIVARDSAAVDMPANSLVIDRREVERCQKVGAAWATDATRPKKVEHHWQKLLADADAPLYDPRTASRGPARWWKHAYALMAIADEACADVGYRPRPGADWSKKWIVNKVEAMLEGVTKTSRTRNVQLVQHVPTITSNLVNEDVICVQPKARTPDVGCSLRNLSHNIALLPPRGVMRAHWLLPPAILPVEESAPLNLLLIPFPYVVEPGWFKAEMATAAGARSPWGWFDLQQKWLDPDPDLVVRLVEGLMLAAQKKREDIHGIVFPEYALTYPIYERLAELLRDKYRTVQFLVSGSSSNCAPDNGNFALASHFFEDPETDDGTLRMMATASRPKHHRWSLDDGQVKSYDLEAAFPKVVGDPEMRWWERIELKPREIHVNGMRGACVFSVMICEDLARSDPAHEPLRAVGPNLVFVLLMDGPQFEWRWSARYSTGLAEDPGSSVLTLTSRALIERWNSVKPDHERSWSVGVWKAEGERAVQIECDRNHEAVILKLVGRRQTERTLDGRSNMQTYAWHKQHDPLPIALSRRTDKELLKQLGL